MAIKKYIMNLFLLHLCSIFRITTVHISVNAIGPTEINVLKNFSRDTFNKQILSLNTVIYTKFALLVIISHGILCQQSMVQYFKRGKSVCCLNEQITCSLVILVYLACFV